MKHLIIYFITENLNAFNSLHQLFINQFEKNCDIRFVIKHPNPSLKSALENQGKSLSSIDECCEILRHAENAGYQKVLLARSHIFGPFSDCSALLGDTKFSDNPDTVFSLGWDAGMDPDLFGGLLVLDPKWLTCENVRDALISDAFSHEHFFPTLLGVLREKSVSVTAIPSSRPLFFNPAVLERNYYDFLKSHQGNEISAALNTVCSEGFPVRELYRELTRKTPGHRLQDYLHLTYALPEKSIGTKNAKSREPRTAVVLFSYYSDHIERHLSYLKGLPEGTRIIVVTSRPEIIDDWKALTSDFSHPIEYRTQPNRGRNESAYWVSARDVFEDADYVCLLHDKKTPHAQNAATGRIWEKHCFDNLLLNRGYIENVIGLFESNPQLGLLFAPMPHFTEMHKHIVNVEWAGNEAAARKLYKDFGLTVPFDEAPYAPWGGMFWVRSQALSVLLSKKWAYEDFPAEPLAADGTLLHVLERMYPMFVQEAGFLSGRIMPQSLFATHYDSLSVIQRTTDIATPNRDYKLTTHSLGLSLRKYFRDKFDRKRKTRH